MRKHNTLLVVMALFLVLVLSACQSGGSETGGSASGGDVQTDFPMPEDASNVTVDNGMLSFETKLSLEEVMAFYRDEYVTNSGYVERADLTDIAPGLLLSMGFDGDPSGKTIVINGVGGDPSSISIRLEDAPK